MDKKKRGRPRKINKIKKNEKIVKNKKICNLNDSKKIELKTHNIERKSIIVHLKIDIDKYEKKNNTYINDFLKYDPNINIEPMGYNIDYLSLDNQSEIIETKKDKTEKVYNVIDNKNKIVKKIHNIMMEFTNFNEKKFLQTKTCCWHCCHSFKSMPCGIPINYEKNLFYVKGIFCSFNCALTYNNNSKENENIIQERESLIYLLYKKINNVKNIDLKYAPEKEVLEMFGGKLTIEEFRENNSTYNIIFPPIVFLIPQLEETKKNIILEKKKLSKSKSSFSIFQNT